MVIFGLECLLRVWCSPESGSHRGRVRFMLEPMMLIDLAVLIVPVYFDLRPLRILRLLRPGRYSPRLRLFARRLRGEARRAARGRLRRPREAHRELDAHVSR